MIQKKRELLIRFQSVMGTVTNNPSEEHQEDVDMMEVEQPVPVHIGGANDLPSAQSLVPPDAKSIDVASGLQEGAAGGNIQGADEADEKSHPEGSGDFVESLMNNFENTSGGATDNNSGLGGDYTTGLSGPEQPVGQQLAEGKAEISVDDGSAAHLPQPELTPSQQPASVQLEQSHSEQQAAQQQPPQQPEQGASSFDGFVDLESFDSSNFDFNFS